MQNWETTCIFKAQSLKRVGILSQWPRLSGVSVTAGTAAAPGRSEIKPRCLRLMVAGRGLKQQGPGLPGASETPGEGKRPGIIVLILSKPTPSSLSTIPRALLEVSV